MEKIRENNIDLLKMICCISVIIIHASARYCTMAVNEGANIYNEGIFFSNLMNCITRFAVPCFVMIAGGFELSKKVSYKEFYKKKGVREKTLKGYIAEQMMNEKDNFLERTEEDIDFNLLLSNLKEEERMIILLFYNGKYTIKEISYILGINENTIKSRLNRAKNKIKISKEEKIIGQDRQIYSKSSE